MVQTCAGAARAESAVTPAVLYNKRQSTVHNSLLYHTAELSCKG